MAEAEKLTEHAHPVLAPGWLVALCRVAAGIGGLTLMAIMTMTVVSVAKRTLLGAPIPGDYEMVEIGGAVAIFCFLPWCQLAGGNVLVDFFTMKAGSGVNHALEAFGDLIYLAVASLIFWRSVHGALEFRQNGEQSMVLGVPTWWSFVIILPAFALLLTTILFTFLGHLQRARL
jgi:TRAP-type C4-dicarboxylate transport system permease small subunit